MGVGTSWAAGATAINRHACFEIEGNETSTKIMLDTSKHRDSGSPRIIGASAAPPDTSHGARRGTDRRHRVDPG
jgi:hypothetical protein